MNSRRYVLPYILLLLLCFWLFLPGISQLPAFDRDEARFVQASKQMIESHRYDQINFQDQPRHLKPPGIYWLQSSATRVFGNDDLSQVWSYRIPSVCGGVLAVVLLYGFFNRSSGSREHAFLAGGVLASTLLLVIESHMGTTDAMLLACIVLMQGGLWKTYATFKKRGHARWYWPAVFWLGMAAGVFIKGTSPLIGLMTVVGLCIADRSVSFIRQLRIWWGVPLLVALSLIWIVPFSQAGHSNFLWDMLHKDALPKIMGSAQGHGAPPGYFLLLLPALFWPCSLLLFRGFTMAWQQRKTPLYCFLFAWIIPSWICIALIHTKLPQYALPLYPALALIVAGLAINKIAMRGRLAQIDLVYRSIWLCLSLLLAAAFPVISYWVVGRFVISSILLSIGVVGLSLLMFKLSSIRFYRSCILLSFLGGVFIYGFLCQFYLEALQPIWITKKVEAVLESRLVTLTDAQPLYVADYSEPSLVFRLGTHKVHFASFNDLVSILKSPSSKLAMMKLSNYEHIKSNHQKYHLKLQPLGFIHGYNYERGRQVDFVVVRSTYNATY